MSFTEQLPSAPGAYRWVHTEVCPSRWEISHRRKEIVTTVVLGRNDGGATAQREYWNIEAQIMYGVETPYQMTDLMCVANAQLDMLGARILRTRGKDTTPRIGAVHIDAATDPAARDLLTLVSPFKPSRYRCRHVLPRGTIFDEELMAAGITHRITPSEWTARISLDIAAPWEAAGARFDESYFDNAIFGV